ncbi:MAG: hypothetical protein H0W66_01815 [Chthoniobacterales bacterium]|nr:hypothetical protein [Chthoniobacterales bacterium]
MIKSLFRQNRHALALAVVGAALTFFIPAGSGAGKASPAAKQAEAQQPGHLLIVRSATLGTIVVGVEIDGKQTARINFGRSYNEPISAGPHVITVTPMPNREHAQPSQTRINVQPGQSYRFTAKQSDVSIVLK